MSNLNAFSTFFVRTNALFPYKSLQKRKKYDRKHSYFIAIIETIFQNAAIIVLNGSLGAKFWIRPVLFVRSRTILNVNRIDCQISKNLAKSET